MGALEVVANKDWTGNGNSIYKTLGASNHTDKEREVNDFYATSPEAIDKLLEVENLYDNIWEPAAGEGHLVKRLREKGYSVFASDIIQRDYPLDDVQDFLNIETSCYKLSYDIVTNPPYKKSLEFVLKALDLIEQGRKVCMFLKLTFLEGKSRYKELFSKYPPKTVYVFSERIMCAKNGDFEGMKAGGGSAVAYAWFVWEKGFTSDTIVKWI